MSAKSNKIELSETFMVMWREEKTLWDVMSPLYRDKKDESLKRMSDKFQIFSEWYFWIKFCFKCNLCFSLPRRFLNFSYAFKLALKLHWLADTQRRYSVPSCSKCEITYRFSKILENTHEGVQLSEVTGLTPS